MVRNKLKTFLFLAALMAASAPMLAQQSAALPPAAAAAEQSIDGEHIRAHVKFLSSDLLEGRGPGVRGGELAALYISTQFALDGLKPAGDNGTYFQRVPLMSVHTVEDKTKFTLVPKSGAPLELKYSVDVVGKDQTGAAISEVDAPIVFVGYGIDAPEYQWNDFAGVDVKGKVLLVIVNEPPSNDPKFFTGAAMTYYGRWVYKYEEAARRGAVGVLIIHRTYLASYGWDVVRNSQAVSKSYLQGDPTATLKAASWIQYDVARKLLAMGGLEIEAAIDAAGKRGFHAVELPVRLHAHVESTVRKYVSDNVVAELPGQQTHPDQAVLYSAHYDHLGIDPAMKGDNIFNGAVDNGTGCGILLEMARAWAEAAANGAQPPHSIYFAAVTAEEQGLLGSQYLGMHPPIPAAQFTLNLNYDALQPVGITDSAIMIGSERTTFYPVVQETAREFHLEIEPDAFPSAGEYYRSDHFSMARTGVPAFSIDQGVLFEGHDRAWGVAKDEDYTAHRYHQPGDEYNDAMDFRGIAKMTRFGFDLGWKAVSAPQPITWQPGDEFLRAREASMKSQ